MVSERLATSNFKMTTSSELRLFTETLQQNNNLLAEEEAKFLPHAQHHKETQDKFLLPPQHHTPDSVLQLLSSVLPLLSVYNILPDAIFLWSWLSPFSEQLSDYNSLHAFSIDFLNTVIRDPDRVRGIFNSNQWLLPNWARSPSVSARYFGSITS